MATLNLNGSNTDYTNIAPRMSALRDRLEVRQPFWNGMNQEQKRKWIKSGKDPLLSLAWTIYKYLYHNWFGDISGVNYDD
jgi:hypothetical protein